MRPTREHATNTGHTYMITSATWGRRSLFAREPWAQLLIDTLYHYRGTAYLLHEFVVMPDHIHVLLTPTTSLEKAVQFIKGGFSFRAKKELGSNMEVWQKGFSDHRIRDAGDCLQHVSYTRLNPVRKHLCERAEEFLYSSAHAGFELDPVPQGLKPVLDKNPYGASEAAPFQSDFHGASEAAPFQNDFHEASRPVPVESNLAGGREAAPSQRKAAVGTAEAASIQGRPVARETNIPIETKDKIA